MCCMANQAVYILMYLPGAERTLENTDAFPGTNSVQDPFSRCKRQDKTERRLATQTSLPTIRVYLPIAGCLICL